MKETEEYYTWKDVSSGTRSFFYFALSQWISAIIIVVLAVSLAIGYYLLQKPKYEAACTFILEEKQGGLGGFGSIASQFGIDLGGVSGGNLFAGDNILDILKSYRITKKVLLSRVDSSNSGGQSLADLYMEFSGLKKSSKLKDISYSSPQNESISLKHDSVLHAIQARLIKGAIHIDRVSRKGTIISVSVTSANQYFSKLMSERIVNEAKNLYINIKAGTAQANVRRLELKADSILRQLNSKTYQAAIAVPIDANPALRSLTVASEISSRDKSVLGAVYLEVIKNLEVSRTLLNQQTPVIQLLDEPQLPIKDERKSLFFLIAISIFIGGILFLVYAWLKYGNRK